MIDDMALLKQAMEQMDSEDPSVAQAAKDRAAMILSQARLSFAKLAELIEQRRLLLRPAILARMKRMDQPGMLGDAAFRDTSSALRKEGQSFIQIAEAIEGAGRPAPRYEEPAQTSEPLHLMANEPARPTASGPPLWVGALVVLSGIVMFPLRHPIRFLGVALLAFLLFYTVRGFVTVGQQVSEYFNGVGSVRERADTAMSSVSSYLNEKILGPSKEATAPPTPPASIPSPSAAVPSPSATPSAAPATAPAPSAAAPAPPATAPLTPPSAAPAPPPASAAAPAPSATAPLTPPSAAPAPPPAASGGPPASTPRRDARAAGPSRSAANCCVPQVERDCRSSRCTPLENDRPRAYENVRPRAFEDMVPEAIRRNSRVAGPCIGGVGGCYWGGGQH